MSLSEQHHDNIPRHPSAGTNKFYSSSLSGGSGSWLAWKVSCLFLFYQVRQ